MKTGVLRTGKMSFLQTRQQFNWDVREEREESGDFLGRYIISIISGDGGKAFLSLCSRGPSHTIKRGHAIYGRRR
jgi:hypothetical protein